MQRLVTSPRAAAAVTAGATSLVVYLWTLAPTVGFIDAGELAAVAHRFGIAHPTGYPLFTLLAGAWARLPLGEVIVRLNVFSALCAAAAVSLYASLLWSLMDALRAAGPGTGARQSQTVAARQERWAQAVASVFGALVIAFVGPFWQIALGVEVYALHALLVAVVLLLTLPMLLHPPTPGEPLPRRTLNAGALALGLAFSNHMTTIYLLPGLAFALVGSCRGRGRAAWRQLAGALPFFAAGLLPYLYLPLRAAGQPLLNWGDPSSWQRFLWHVSGKQYREWVFSSTEVAGRQLSAFLSGLPTDYAWIGLALAPVGLWWTLRRRPLLGWTLVIFAAVCVAYSVNYDIHDLDSYFILAHVCCGLWAGLGLYCLLAARRPGRKAAVSFAAATLLVMLFTTGPRVSERGNYLVEDYTRNMFASFADNALVLSYQWDYWISASYYYQLVDGLRPDVTVIDKELLRRSHYLAQIKRNYPQICRGSEAAFAAFEEQLYRFEHGLRYDPQRIEARFNELIDSLVDRNYRARPVYFTLEMEAHLARGYQRVPEGLAFRLYRPGDPPSPATKVWDDFRVRPFARDDFYTRALRSAYPTMLTNRGIYLAQNRRFGQAMGTFDRALGFDPDFAVALQWQQRIAAAAPPAPAVQ